MIRMSPTVYRRFLADKTVFPKGMRLQLPNPGIEADDDIASIYGGEIQGGNPEVPSDLKQAFHWWRERQPSETFAVSVPRDQIDAMKAALAALGLEAKSLDFL